MTSVTRTVGFVSLPLNALGLTGREEIYDFQQAIKRLLEDHLEGRDGKIVKSLDSGFLLLIGSATESILLANDVQASIKGSDIAGVRNATGIQISLHTGEVAIDDEGDVYGQTVNTAARLVKKAVLGQVILSGTTVLAAESESLDQDDILVEPMGQEHPKGLPQPLDVYSSGLKPLEEIPYHREEPFQTEEPETTSNSSSLFIVGSIMLFFLMVAVSGTAYYFYYYRQSVPTKEQSAKKTDVSDFASPLSAVMRSQETSSNDTGDNSAADTGAKLWSAATASEDVPNFNGLTETHRTKVERYFSDEISSRGPGHEPGYTFQYQEQLYRDGLRYLAYKLERYNQPLPDSQRSFESWFNQNISYDGLKWSPAGQPLRYLLTPGNERKFTLNYLDSKRQIWLSYVGGVKGHYGVTSHVAYRRNSSRLTTISSNLYFNNQSWQSPVGQLFAEAVRRRTGADIALINFSSLRGSFSRGPITRAHIRRSYPWDNKAVVLDVPLDAFVEAIRANCNPPGTYLSSGIKKTPDGLVLTETGAVLKDLSTLKVAVSEYVGDWDSDERSRHRTFRQQEVVERSEKSLPFLVIEELKGRQNVDPFLDYGPDETAPLIEICQGGLST